MRDTHKLLSGFYNCITIDVKLKAVILRILWDTYHSINVWVNQYFLFMTTLRLTGAYSHPSVAITGVCNYYDYMNGIKYWYVIMAQGAQPSRKMRSKANFFRKLHYGVDIIPAVNLPMPEIVSDKKVQRS